MWAYKERRNTVKYEVSAKQRLDLKCQILQAERNPESKALPSLELSSLSPRLKPSPTCNTRPLPQLCSRMNSKSLAAVPVGAHHQRGSVTLLSRDEFPASLQSHNFLGEGHKIAEIRNLFLFHPIVLAASSLNVESILDSCRELSYRNSSSTYGRALWEMALWMALSRWCHVENGMEPWLLIFLSWNWLKGPITCRNKIL